jgi:amino acid transporter
MPIAYDPIPANRKKKQVESLPPPPKYHSSFGWLRHMVFGKALPSSRMAHEKLSNLLALPIFSSDALSSNAYATEAILGVLLVSKGGTASLHMALPIAIGISILLAIVVLSYRQIIFAYPDGGGAYPVSRDNLGTNASLIAGASLLIDYVLTVATSVAAGAAAIVTMVGAMAASGTPHMEGLLTFLNGHIAITCIFAIWLITLGNLRGVRETGWWFATPTYVFIFSLIGTIIAGCAGMLFHAHYLQTAVDTGRTINASDVGVSYIGWYMIFQAFSQGCTALTGVEAISNTVPLFRKPQDKNAAATMTWMGILAIIMFVGLTYLTGQFGIKDHLDQSSTHYQSVIGQVANIAWPPLLHWMFFVLQISTALVLILAANTAFAGFPQLASMLAQDNFLPRQLANIGDRLAFSNGIILLAVAASALIWVFQGIVDDLLSLYAIGVFTSFTLAQTGMVLRWNRLRTPGWQTSLMFNLLGAVATGFVTAIIAFSKFADGKAISPDLHFGTLQTDNTWKIVATNPFTHHALLIPSQPVYGAWIVIVLVPIMVWMFKKIHNHYMEMSSELSVEGYVPVIPKHNVVLVLVPRVHRGIVQALNYARLVSDDVRGVYVSTNPETTALIKKEWEEWAGDIPLVIMESPFRSLIRPLLLYIDAVQKERNDDYVTVVLPEIVASKAWHRLLHNQAAPLLKLYLSSRKDVIVTSVRYFLEH